MSRNFIVYQSRNRQTGTQMYMYDMRHADAAPVKAGLEKAGKKAVTKRYIAFCQDHAQFIEFDEHYFAGQAIAWPAGDPNRAETLKPWCTVCTAMYKEGKKVAKDGAPKAATPQAPVAKAPEPAPSNGKRTSSKSDNATATRKANAQKAPGPVVTKEPVAPPVAVVEPVPAKRGRRPAVKA